MVVWNSGIDILKYILGLHSNFFRCVTASVLIRPVRLATGHLTVPVRSDAVLTRRRPWTIRQWGYTAFVVRLFLKRMRSPRSPPSSSPSSSPSRRSSPGHCFVFRGIPVRVVIYTTTQFVPSSWLAIPQIPVGHYRSPYHHYQYYHSEAVVAAAGRRGLLLP